MPVPLIFTGPSGGHFRESPLALHAAVPGLWHFQTHQPKTHAGLFYLMGIFIYPLIKYLAAAIILANECEQDPSVFNAWVLLFISQPHHTIPALIQGHGYRASCQNLIYKFQALLESISSSQTRI